MPELYAWYPDRWLRAILSTVADAPSLPDPGDSHFDLFERCALVVRKPEGGHAWTELGVLARSSSPNRAALLRAVALEVPLFRLVALRFGPTSVPLRLVYAFFAAVGYPPGRCAAHAVSWYVNARSAIASENPEAAADLPLLERPAGLVPGGGWVFTGALPSRPSPPAPLPTRDFVRGDGRCWRCGTDIDRTAATCRPCAVFVALLAREVGRARSVERYLGHPVCILCYAPIPAGRSAAEICCRSRCSGRKSHVPDHKRLAALLHPDPVPTPVPFRPDPVSTFLDVSLSEHLRRLVATRTERYAALVNRLRALIEDADTDVFACASWLAAARFELRPERTLERTDPILFRGEPVSPGGLRAGWRASLRSPPVTLRAVPLSGRPTRHDFVSGDLPVEHYPLWAFELRLGPSVDRFQVLVEVPCAGAAAVLLCDSGIGPPGWSPVESCAAALRVLLDRVAHFIEVAP